MSAAAVPVAPRLLNNPAAAKKALHAAAACWFVTALAGQLIFAVYIAALYGLAAIRGDWAQWNKVMPHGLIAGDGAGNVAIVVHVLLAFVITVLGPLQLIPRVRGRWPVFHRWSGRLYLATALLITLGGLYVIWSRSHLPDWSPLNAAAISLNALLILLFGGLAWREAVARNLVAHRRWALRLFLAVSGVWFLRVGVMLWILLFGPTGLGERLGGPVGIALAFAQYLVPLAVLELYLRAQGNGGATARYAVAALLGILTLATAAGTGMASLFLWLPHIG